MKIILEGEELFELTETQKKVIKNDLLEEIFDSDMTRRLKYWVESPIHKYAHRKYDELVEELRQKGEATIPTDKTKVYIRCAELNPPEQGFSDLKDLNCQCGEQTFTISKDCCVGWRDFLKRKFPRLSTIQLKEKESYVIRERLKYILNEKYNRCLERLKLAWLPVLSSRGVESIPADDEDLCNLIFSQPDYKNRSQRASEEGQ